ncbi:MAG: hypothetical protein DMG15_19310 [Acidobacteria bacterium]|nr:MAG: hypothetical protein DMG15_19310 [Acidobacteriota bacterium]
MNSGGKNPYLCRRVRNSDGAAASAGNFTNPTEDFGFPAQDLTNPVTDFAFSMLAVVLVR